MNLGGALSRLYGATNNDDDYEEANRFLAEAQSLLSGSADIAGVLDNQAATLLTHYRNKRRVEDLDELISLLDRAVLIPGTPGLINDRKRSLANGLALRYLLRSEEKDRSRAQKLFRETTDSPSGNAGGGLSMTLTRADFAFKCATAAEAAGALNRHYGMKPWRPAKLRQRGPPSSYSANSRGDIVPPGCELPNLFPGSMRTVLRDWESWSAPWRCWKEDAAYSLLRLSIVIARTSSIWHQSGNRTCWTATAEPLQQLSSQNSSSIYQAMWRAFLPIALAGKESHKVSAAYRH